jgi:hypothetical protein
MKKNILHGFTFFLRISKKNYILQAPRTNLQKIILASFNIKTKNKKTNLVHK